MGFLSNWITNIILLILFATILELLLPNSSMQRYVKLVVGLMLLMALIQPVLSVLQEDPETLVQQLDDWGYEMNEMGTNLDDIKKSDIESEQLAYISEQVAVQLKDKAQSVMIEEFQKSITEVTVSFKSLHDQNWVENLSGINVIIHSVKSAQITKKKDGEIEEINIEPIEIKTESAPMTQEEDMEGSNDMKDRLSELWEVRKEIISIQEKGVRMNE